MITNDYINLPLINDHSKIILTLIYSFIISIFASLLVKYLSGDIKKYILYYSYEEDINSKQKNKLISKKKKKIGLLTNEIPPIIYGGVATWIINFMDMFENDEDYEVIPIFLAIKDKPNKKILKKYPNMKVIYNKDDIGCAFENIDICINNLWISYELIKEIKFMFPSLLLITVCHSIIKMEHLTNMESPNTKQYYEQEITFEYSDVVLLISESEKEHYINLGYDKYKADLYVIHNSYKPKYDKEYKKIDYNLNDVGYIGRHVPRKRPELPIMAVSKSDIGKVKVYNMGIKSENEYWNNLIKEYNDTLNVIQFTSDKNIIEDYWSKIGVNSITGIYEPFGYTMCETLDRRIPAIVPNIGGPKEITNKVKDYVFMYDVDLDIERDINNYLKALRKFWKTDPEVRQKMAEKARIALDDFRPEVIKMKWKELLDNKKAKDIRLYKDKIYINRDNLNRILCDYNLN